ncbi:MAG: oxaloacetate decarboxylase [Ruminococcaceae bacterium]|nr:oxaloacetate decarboxylase [Oscillospiraceae bacterium]
MNINPMAFVENLEYMGLGMLGIFIVIGLVVLVTVVLNKVTANKKDDNNQ